MAWAVEVQRSLWGRQIHRPYLFTRTMISPKIVPCKPFNLCMRCSMFHACACRLNAIQ